MPQPQRPEQSEYGAYYHRYIERVPDGDVRMIMRVQLADTLALLRPLSEEQAGFRYAEGKWSIRQVIGHLADTERIFVYRALRIARGDQTPLAGFNENVYADKGGFDERPLHSLLAELEATRAASAAFFQSLSEGAWTCMGTANDYPISVRALAYIMAGHELHHRAILQDKYLAPGAPAQG
ncbi:MAG: DinB family protein [Longimicrobiales bacterium]